MQFFMTNVLPVLVAVVVIVGCVLIPKKARQRFSESMVDPATGQTLPNENPATNAVLKPGDVQEFEAVNVARPTMLAFSGLRSDAGEVFVQRAFKIDRPHWKELPSMQSLHRLLEPMFSRCCALAWVTGSDFERHFYAVSFSPEIEDVLQAGGKITGDPVELRAIDETGAQLGDASPVSNGAQLYMNIWDALHPKGQQHELQDDMDAELSTLANHVDFIEDRVMPEPAAQWQAIFEEVNDIESGRARIEELPGLQNRIAEETWRLRDGVAEMIKEAKSPDEIRKAMNDVTEDLSLIDLGIRMLRVLKLIRIIKGDRDGISSLTADVKSFPDVSKLVEAAAVLEDEPKDGDATLLQELQAIHDGYLQDLEVNADRLQAAVDRCLYWSTRPRRYAVRVSDEGKVEHFYILNA
ncbi:MAG: hypothetical protein HUK26_01425 [Duodenibacillus sp.]|nr:hypothetical protein [Duodenibacillus sp.]